MKQIKERFMEKVDCSSAITSPNAKTPCWIWKGSQSGSGYGQFWNGKRNIPAHWFLLESFPMRGMEACHICDNKLCVRPSHLFIGSRSDNMKDMVSKGRHNTKPGCVAMLKVRKLRYAESNHQNKLTTDQAMEALNCSRARGVAMELARKFNVSVTLICNIRDGRAWKHLL